MPTIGEILAGQGVDAELFKSLFAEPEKDRLLWMNENLITMLNLLQTYGYKVPEDHSKPVKVKRLIQVNTYIENYLLEYHKTEYVCLSGFFVVADGYYIPSDLYQKAFKDPAHARPEEYGLPSPSDVNYGTVQNALHGMHFVLDRHSWLSDFLPTAGYYTYLVEDDLA